MRSNGFADAKCCAWMLVFDPDEAISFFFLPALFHLSVRKLTPDDPVERKILVAEMQRCRELAAETTDPAIAQAFLTLVEDYERLIAAMDGEDAGQ